MKLSEFHRSQSDSVVTLFAQVFTHSEGVAEGESISHLVSELIGASQDDDVIGYVATEKGRIIGCIFFSRFTLHSKKVAFILSPVAVATDQQGKRVGKRLIEYGIDQLRKKSVDILLTYGDPAYYSKVGFQRISQAVIRAPFELTYPNGWQAQSLTGAQIEPIDGTTLCVKPLQNQKYW